MKHKLPMLLLVLSSLAVAQLRERPPGSPGTPTPQPYSLPPAMTIPRLPSGNPPLLPPLPPAKGNPRQESLPLIDEQQQRAPKPSEPLNDPRPNL
ncbi:MAG: hypothetical protein ACRERY_02740 [Pseudomonas sp.]